MTDWIEHNGGPQPVGNDVWVVLDKVGFGSGYATAWQPAWLNWNKPIHYRILNQHLIDAARLEGIRLGLEAAAKEAEYARWRWSTWDNHPRMSQWAKSRQRTYEICELLIRDLNPETIAREGLTKPAQSDLPPSSSDTIAKEADQ